MNYSIFGIISIIGMIISIGFLPNAHAEDEFVPSWKLIFINDEHRCLNEEQSTTAELTSLTKQYFREYKFDNKHVESLCVSMEQYQQMTTSDDLSLIILVLDNHVGNKILAKNGYEGMYTHLGDDKSIKHTIILKTNSVNDLYTATSTTWLLTSELSHYILSYKGYNANAIEYLLHHDKLNYQDCVGKSSSYEQCRNVKTIMRPVDLGKDFYVMPVYEPVVGKTFVKYLPDDLLSSKITIELQREITKWWINGLIDDASYSNAVLHIINSPRVINSTINDEVMILPNGFAILEKNSKQTMEWSPGPFEAFAIEGDVSAMFSLVPFTADDIVHELKEYPKWFKIRAELWSDEKIPDKIYFDGLEALLRLGIITQ